MVSACGQERERSTLCCCCCSCCAGSLNKRARSLTRSLSHSLRRSCLVRSLSLWLNLLFYFGGFSSFVCRFYLFTFCDCVCVCVCACVVCACLLSQCSSSSRLKFKPHFHYFCSLSDALPPSSTPSAPIPCCSAFLFDITTEAVIFFINTFPTTTTSKFVFVLKSCQIVYSLSLSLLLLIAFVLSASFL